MREGDAAGFLEICRNADVRRYLLDDQLVDLAWVRHEIRSSRALFRELGCGLWGVRLHGSGQLIGFVGYRYFFDPPELQLLYALHPEWWGRGLATEAAGAVLRYGFDVLGFDVIEASVDAPNVASARVLERLGMTLVRQSRREGRPTLDYAVHRNGRARTVAS